MSARTHPPVDVVTVGGGWTAAILASKLCPQGRTMVSLEQGASRWTYPEYAHDHDSLRYSGRYAMMVNLRQETWTWRPHPRVTALPMRQYGSFNPGQGLGGSGVHWSGQLWRFMPTDFVRRTHVTERYGAKRIPADMTLQDWGVTYDELEPYYDQFEWDIGAGGAAGNVGGRILPGGNPFEGPRSRGYPNPPLVVTPYGQMFADACTDLGLHPFTQPTGILSRGWIDPHGNARSGCLYCGFCTRFGCEVDAKSSPQNTHLPVALDTGRYEVRLGCKVTRIEVDDRGRATGLTYVDAEGREHFQPARVVVASAFTLENTRILLLSRSRAHPNGVGNDRGRVGRNYTYQIYPAPVTGVFQGRKLNMFMGNTCTIKVIYDYNGDNFDHSDLDFIGGSQLYSEPCEREPFNSVDGLTTRDGKAWGAAWKEELRRNWDSHASILTEGESNPYEDQFLDLDPNYTDRFGNPLLRIAFDWHPNEQRMWRYLAARAREIMARMNPSRIVRTMPELGRYNIHDYQSTHPTGGCVMGTDPGTSVTNTHGQVWDTPNVFVTGAALFPQNAGANPTGTIGALTYRTAQAMDDRYFDDPGELLS
ncbi:MAG: GMC family oxidoreductase [Thermoleophilia bacterium]|nr:GMC family oxidoreductase [Thermoleophilia bacterium]